MYPDNPFEGKSMKHVTTAEVVEAFSQPEGVSDDDHDAAAMALVRRLAWQGVGDPYEYDEREDSTKLVYHLSEGGAGIMPGLWDGINVRLTEVYHTVATNDESHPNYDEDRPLYVCLIVYGWGDRAVA